VIASAECDEEDIDGLPRRPRRLSRLEEKTGAARAKLLMKPRN
jgi:hypothetical protein